MNRVVSTIYAVYFFVMAAIFFPVSLVLAAVAPLIDQHKRMLNSICGAYTFKVLTISPFWSFTYEGTQNLVGGPYVLVANHQSLADIVVVYGLHYPLRWVSKGGIFHVPFLGWIMSCCGHLQLSKGDLSSTRTMLRKCADWLHAGISIAMFPEGTRSPDGEVHQFLSGPFWLAKYAGVSVVPIAIDGTLELLPKGSSLMNFSVPVRVRVLPPVSPSEFGGDTESFKQYVHLQIAEALADMRGKPSQPVEQQARRAS